MKKIVALVLSLAMALSLCTAAFAAVKDGDKFYATPNQGAAVYVYTVPSTEMVLSLLMLLTTFIMSSVSTTTCVVP